MSPIRTRLHRLRDHGQSAWVDYLSRTFVRDGELAASIRDGVAGVTSNPTIQGAIGDSDVYDAQLTVLANQDVGPKDAFLALARKERGQTALDRATRLGIDGHAALMPLDSRCVDVRTVGESPDGMPRQAPTEATFQEARDRLAARMRELRDAASMPQSLAASRAGMDRTNWGRIEAGKLDVRLDTLLRIQFALGVDTLEALFGETTGDLFGRGRTRCRD